MKEKKIAIIGGGIAGASTALFLGSMGIKVTLFERERSLVGGPPFCHLHAGGNLYPDISDEQCMTLLRQSIDFARLFPQAIDHRPTVIALPTEGCGMRVEDLLPRLHKLRDYYQTSIQEDPKNQVLGEYASYFKLYTQEKLEQLKPLATPQTPRSFDEWMIPVAQHLDFNTVQFPLILVQEYGINLFRASAILSLALQNLESVEVCFESNVIDIQQKDSNWYLSHQINKHTSTAKFDYVINATGFRTGTIDDMIGIECKKMVEFKAAYVSQWESMCNQHFPEIIFHGKRGTPNGMGQFTPYPNGYFQLHGMTEEITLYPDGLVKNSPISCQPKLPQKFVSKIETSWNPKEIAQRTQKAIQHLSRFIPRFSQATIGSKPLYGAQQIPGEDPSLRVAEVAFPAPYYARCEIVKVSSVLDMVSEIINDLQALHLLPMDRQYPTIHTKIEEKEIQQRAEKIAQQRNYPQSLSQINCP